MKSSAKTVQAYLEELPVNQREPFELLRKTLVDHLPEGLEEVMSYGMIGYVVPKSIYPAGYHCDTSLPLPFINLAAQKSSINLYHMGIYAKPELYEWFQSERKKRCSVKLDMGKSCIRLKNYDAIPYELLGELVEKMSVEERIEIYESVIKK